MMKRTAILAAFALACSAPAFAGEARGGGALMLAAEIGARSPALSHAQKAALKDIGEGRAKVGAPFHVKADAIACRAGNVDIASHACTITIAGRALRIDGRCAHEIFATLLEIGVAPEGAAGTIHAGLAALDCTIDPAAIADRAGAGATCVWREAP
jgi:hypothetical protein